MNDWRNFMPIFSIAIFIRWIDIGQVDRQIGFYYVPNDALAFLFASTQQTWLWEVGTELRSRIREGLAENKLRICCDRPSYQPDGLPSMPRGTTGTCADEQPAAAEMRRAISFGKKCRSFLENSLSREPFGHLEPDGGGPAVGMAPVEIECTLHPLERETQTRSADPKIPIFVPAKLCRKATYTLPQRSPHDNARAGQPLHLC